MQLGSDAETLGITSSRPALAPSGVLWGHVGIR